MNLFEKIYNQQILALLDDREMALISTQERSWLKQMLRHPDAKFAFDSGTFERLVVLLADEPDLNTSGLIEKARVAEHGLFHPLFRPIRSIIEQTQAICVHFRDLPGSHRPPQTGVPYQLEFSLAKRIWYLLWMPDSHRVLFRTKLASIASIEPIETSIDRVQAVIKRIEAHIQKQKQHCKIDILPAYHAEMTRILYAFSCFEREIHYDQNHDRYTIHLTFDRQESEYLLSRLRFLGKRIRVYDNAYLSGRMLESATMALARYDE